MERLSIPTRQREEIVDITSFLQTYLEENRLASGILVVYCPHTTAALTVNENADPDVKKDIGHFLKKLVPQSSGFAHAEGNSDAHIKGSLLGFSHSFIVQDGLIQLGTWQGIYFMEFDGPRQREVWLKFIAE